MSGRELTEHDPGSFIDQTTTGYAQDGMFALPFRRQIALVENRQIFNRSILSHGFYRGCSFRVGGPAVFQYRTVVPFRNVVYEFADSFLELLQAFRIKRTAFGIGLSQLQSLQSDFAIITTEGSLLQKLFRFFRSLGWISGQHPLIKYLGRSEGRTIPEHYVQKFQALDMTPKYDKADRQRSG